MNTTINEAAITSGANVAAGANANDVNEAFEELYSCSKCDKFNRYYTKESNWVHLAVLPPTAVWEINDEELKDFGNKLWDKASSLAYFINLRFLVVNDITTRLEYFINKVPQDKASVEEVVHRRWIQLVCQGVISL